MIFGAILAGGIGSRMKKHNIPKQFIEINNKPIIIYTIEKMLSLKAIDKLCIAVHSDYINYLKNLLDKYKLFNDRIIITDGGKERIDSIQNVINAITKISNNDDDIIILHDAVRPFVSEKILLDSISAAQQFGACVAVVPAVDTMYEVSDEFINGFPNRNVLYNGQAPDTFKLRLLSSAIDRLTEEERQKITGTVQICAAKGYKIKTIEGDYKNMKITTENDLLIAKQYIEEGNL